MMSEANGREDELRDARIGKILSDYADRRAAGEAESEAELLAAHPDLADDLRMHLDMLRNLGSGQARIDALITQGILHRTSDPQYPAQFDPYRIKGFIGQGGMGIVLKAYEESLKRTVALKILRPDLAGDPTSLARFKREAQAAAALRHPNIVTVHAVGEEHGVHFLAMEFIDGPSLRGFIQETGPLVDVGAPSLAQVAAGVSPAEVGWPTSLEVGDRFESTGAGAPSLAQQGVGDGLHSPTFENVAHASLSPETIRAIFRQLLSGLATAHDAGLIHRDIKSSNILLDKGWHGQAEPRATEAELVRGEHLEPPPTDKEQPSLRSDRPLSVPPGHQSSIDALQSSVVKIADFGLARMLSSRTRMTMTGSVLGTPEYMSPEQARGDTELDHRTDLYSAGVVLYEMLTGQTPFRADTPSAVIHQILHHAPPAPRPINKDADSHLASLALRLMAKRLEDRFDSASETIAALDASARIRSPERRRRMYRRALIGLLVFAAIAGAVLWDRLSSRLRDQPPITRVWIDEDLETRILVERGHDLTPHPFYTFPPDVGRVNDTVVIHTGSDGRQLVVAGVNKPWDGGGHFSVCPDVEAESSRAAAERQCCVFAFEPDGSPLWCLEFLAEHKWPDCPLIHPSTPLGRVRLTTADLDNKPGDELVVAARDEIEYPTRISIIDPRTPAVHSSFRHMGHLVNLRIVGNFFDGERPAIMTTGLNNKLCGFDDGLREGERQLTQYDIVPVITILDPQHMDGLGPPYANPNRFPEGFKPVIPHAYAFLDLPYSSKVFRVSYTSRNESPTKHKLPDDLSPEQMGYIATVDGHDEYSAGRSDGTAPWFSIDIRRPGPQKSLGRVILIVDRNLKLRDVRLITVGGELEGVTKEYWEQFWRPIIQNGKYVNTNGRAD